MGGGRAWQGRGRAVSAVAAQLIGSCLICLPRHSAAFSAALSPSAACAFAPCSAFVRGQEVARRTVGCEFTRPLCGQGPTAARMGVLRVITPEEIPVDCSEPVDPKALETAKAVIKDIRSALSVRSSRRARGTQAGGASPAGCLRYQAFSLSPQTAQRSGSRPNCEPEGAQTDSGKPAVSGERQRCLSRPSSLAKSRRATGIFRTRFLDV